MRCEIHILRKRNKYNLRRVCTKSCHKSQQVSRKPLIRHSTIDISVTLIACTTKKSSRIDLLRINLIRKIIPCALKADTKSSRKLGVINWKAE